MDTKKVINMGLREMQNFPIPLSTEKRYLSDDFGIVVACDEQVNPSFLAGIPMRLMEGRILLLCSGTITGMINLRKYQYQAGTFVVVAPNTLVQILDYSPDVSIKMLAFSAELLKKGEEEIVQKFLSGRMNLITFPSEADLRCIQSFFSLFSEVVLGKNFSRDVVRHLLLAFLCQLDSISQENAQQVGKTDSRKETLFNQFLDLVNAYGKRERSVAFYADKLCLTPRYLNTLIHETSGKTIMEWVNEAVTLEAKVLLRHTNKPVYEIAEELNFPNASFFTQFFRRQAGMTPLQYRNERE